MRIHKRLGLVALSCLTLVSCGVSDFVVVPTASNEAELVEGSSGILLVQVADTTPFGSVLPPNRLNLAPRDVNESKQVKFPSLVAAESPGDSTQFFYSVLPANEYSLGSLESSYQLGDSYYYRHYPADIELGTFVIEPGKITDLGVLAIYVERSGDEYGWKTIRTSTAGRALEVFKSAVPDLSRRVENFAAPLTWTVDGNDLDREDDYVNAANRQVVFSQPYVDVKSGALKLPSRLGVFAVRDSDGNWKTDAIPNDVELSRITTTDKADVVLTEFDELLSRTKGNSEWEEIESPPGEGEITFIGNHTDVGLFVVRMTLYDITVWSRRSPDDEWTVAAKVVPPDRNFFQALGNSFLNLDRNTRLSGYAVDGNYLYVPFSRKTHRIDLRNGVVTKLGGRRVDSIQALNGVITSSVYEFSSAGRVSFDLVILGAGGKAIYLINEPKLRTDTHSAKPRWEWGVQTLLGTQSSLTQMLVLQFTSDESERHHHF